MNRRNFVKLSSTAAMTGLAGCGGMLGGGSRDPIKLGVVLPLSGVLGGFGKPMRDAALLAVEQVNNSDVGLSVNEQVEDTGSKLQGNVDAVNSLADAGYPMLCGPADKSVEVGKKTFVPKKLVACTPSHTLPAVTTFEDDDLLYRTTPSDREQGKVMSQVATDRLGDKTAAVTYIGNSYGKTLSKAFADAFESKGGTVQKRVAHKPKQSSYKKTLEKTLADDPDVLVTVTFPGPGVQLFRDYYDGFNNGRDIIISDGAANPTLPKKVGNPMKEVVGTAPAQAGPGKDAFDKRYKKEYNSSPGPFTGQTYDAAAVPILANAAAGKNDGVSVRDEMRAVANPSGKKVTVENFAEGVKMAAEGKDVNYQGVASTTNFDDHGDLKKASYLVWEFKPDSESVVSPIDTVTI